MNIVDFSMNYRRFLESRRYVADPCEEETLKSQGFNPCPAWVYLNELVIYTPEASVFELVIGNMSVTSDRLEVLEAALFDWAKSEGYFE